MKLETIEQVQMESRFSDIKYVMVGALYGFLIGNAFAITGLLIDRLLYPDLPLGLDWSLFAMRWGWIALGLALIGAVASLFRERLPSLLVGAVIAGLLALLSALFFSPATTGTKLIVLIFGLLPVAAMSLPVTLILRWLVDQHEHALEIRQGLARIIPLVLLAVVLGIGSGYFLKMPKRALEATRFLHQRLEIAPQEMDSTLHDLAGFQSHEGMSYQLFQKPSESSTEGFDVRANYKDGYSLTCTVVVYPGTQPYIADCTSTQN